MHTALRASAYSALLYTRARVTLHGTGRLTTR
jgi:hypothetical protein